MNTSTIIILVIVIAIAALALKGSIGHFQGAKIGEKTVHIEGMHCENCKNRVERAINRIDGAVAKVDLKKKIAVVSYDREIAEEDIRKAVEEQDYKVTSIQ